MWAFGASGQLIVTGSKPYRPNATASTPDTVEVRIDFRLSGTSSSVTGTWNTAAGQPTSAVVSISNLVDKNNTATGWGFTTIATGNWIAYSGGSANNAVSGITGGTSLSGASAGVYQSIWYNYGTITPARYDATKPQFKLTGLNTSKTYSIQVAGSKGTLGFDSRNMIWQVTGATTPATQELDGGTSGSNITNVTTSLTFTVQPNGSGEISIWMNTMASGTQGSSDLAEVCAMIIKQY